MITKSEILDIVNKIVLNANPDKIYLFGSYTTGDANQDSDIDLLIIKDTIATRIKRSIEIQKLLIGTKVPADILVYTNKEFEEEKSKKFSFLNSAIKKAQILYERKH